MQKKLIISLMLVFMGMVIFATTGIAENNIEIFTSIYPLQEAAERIGGDKINVNLVIPDGDEVHGSELTPGKIAALENADLFFYIGLGLEPWAVQLVTNLKELGVDTVKVSKNLNLREFSDSEDKHGHSHNNDEHDENYHQHEEIHHEHEHGKYDPHVWLDPHNMKEIGNTIKEKLIKYDPQNKNYYEDNYKDFIEKLDELDQLYKEKLSPENDDIILVSHAAFGYLGDRYGFRQLSVTGVSPHEEPGFATIVNLVEKSREYEIDYIFMEVLASPETVEIIAEEANLEVLILNPLPGLTREQRGKNENYFTIMEKNLESLSKALGE